MPQLQLADTFIGYETEGAGEPLIFLNGIMMSIASWALQRRHFAQRYQCIFHDFRDQLLSGRSRENYSMEVHADDLACLLDHLGIERCHIVGTSYGGEVGMIFALKYPQRVKTLSVIASVPCSDALLRLQVQLWRRAARFSADWLYELVAAFSFSGRYLGANPDFLRNSIERISSLPPDYFEGFIRLCDAFLQFDIRDQLHQINAPTLIVSPGADILKVPWYSRYMADRIPGAILWELPNAGHAAILEQPEALNKRLEAFLLEGK